MATVSSSSLSTIKFRVLGFQHSSIRPEISSISISKLRSKASSPSSNHLLVSSSFRFENVKTSQMKQRIPVVFANPSQGGDIVKGKPEATTTEPQGQGPPFLTILAGFALFFFIAWIVGSIGMWFLSLIVSVFPK